MNVRSLRKHLDELTSLVSAFKRTIHAIVLTESWLEIDHISVVNIPGYNVIHSIRNTSDGFSIGGGVSIFILADLTYNVVYENVEDNNNLIVINLPLQKMFLCGIYNNPRSNIDLFLDKIHDITSKFKKLIIFGDFNINLLNFNDNKVNLYTSIIHSNGCIFLNKLSTEFATRISNTVSTVIDHVITDLVQYNYSFFLSPTCISDHEMILLSFNKMTTKKKEIQKKIIIDYNTIAESSVLNSVNDCSSFVELIQFIQKIIKENTKTINIANNKKFKNPWMNKNILVTMKIRDMFYKIKKKYPSDIYVLNKFIFYRNKVANLVKSAKKSYYNNLFENSGNNLKKTWSIVNELIGNKSKLRNPDKIVLKVNDVIISDPELCANSFNDYFSTAAGQLTENMPESNDFLNFLITYEGCSTLHFQPTTTAEIFQLITNLNSSSAVGFDGISCSFLKRFAAELSPITSKLINNVFVSGCVPDILKISKVIPVYKSGDKNCCSNFRPIAMQGGFCKVFESAAQSRLKKHLETNRITNINQFGFTDSSNTTAATLQLVTSIQNNLDRGKLVSCLFLDLSKAFDCVDSRILCKKLEHINLDEKLISLFASYFHNRTQVVCVNGVSSNVLGIKKGVPQGSTNGPMLFNIYINDICNIKLNGNIQLYADDLAIVYASDDVIQLSNNMQADLDLLVSWFDSNLLKINVKKTNYIIFEKRNVFLDDSFHLHLSVYGVLLDRVTSTTFLGLTVDSKLNWHNHVEKLKRSINPIIFAIRRIRYVISEKTAWSMYYAFVHSKLSYLNPIWSCIGIGKQHELQVLQNRVVKCIKGLPWLSHTADLYDSKLLSFKVLIDYELLFLVFKIKCKLLKCNKELTLNHMVHNHATRSNLHFTISRYNTTHGYNSVFHRGLVQFNALPSEIKDEMRISTFKNKLKDFLS